MGKMKGAYLDYACNLLGISHKLISTLSVIEIEERLKSLEEQLIEKEEELEKEIDEAYYDVDVDEDRPFITIDEGGH